MDILGLLDQTRRALDEFFRAASRLGTEVQESIPWRYEDVQCEKLGHYFKPVALDCGMAIEAMEGRGQAQYQLISEIYDLQDIIMRKKRAMESHTLLTAEFCDRIAESTQRILRRARVQMSLAYILR